MKSLTITLLALGVAISLTSCNKQIQASGLTKTEAIEAPAVSAAQLMGLHVDFSGSPSKVELDRLAPELVAGIRSHAESIDGVALTRLANGNRPTLSESPEIFQWGRLKIEPFTTPDLANAPADVRFFEDKRRRYIKDAQEKYKKETEQKRQEYYSRVDSELERLRAALLQGPAEPAPCTRFSSIVIRIERDNYPVSILITDGWRDCANERGRRLASARLSGKMAVLQLTRANDNAAADDALREREVFLRELFPGAPVLPAYKTSAAFEFLFGG